MKENKKDYGYSVCNIPMITFNLSKEISSSDEYVEIINRMGLLKAQGFQNLDYDGKIFFKGKVEFVISK